MWTCELGLFHNFCYSKLSLGLKVNFYMDKTHWKTRFEKRVIHLLLATVKCRWWVLLSWIELLNIWDFWWGNKWCIWTSGRWLTSMIQSSRLLYKHSVIQSKQVFTVCQGCDMLFLFEQGLLYTRSAAIAATQTGRNTTGGLFLEPKPSRKQDYCEICSRINHAQCQCHISEVIVISC